MSIASGTFYYAVCDKCGERIQLYDEGGYMVGESPAEVIEYVKDNGRIADDGAVTCNACIEEEPVAEHVTTGGPE